MREAGIERKQKASRLLETPHRAVLPRVTDLRAGRRRLNIRVPEVILGKGAVIGRVEHVDGVAMAKHMDVAPRRWQAMSLSACPIQRRSAGGLTKTQRAKRAAKG